MPLRACPICQAETPASCEIGDLAPTVQTASGTDKYTLSYCGCGELVFVSPEPTGDDLDLIYRQNEQFFGFYRDPAYIKQAQEWHTNTLYGLLSESYGRNVVFGRLRLLEIGSGLAWMCRAAKALSPEFTTVAQDVTPEVSGECPWVDHYLVGEIDDPRFDKFAPFDMISMTHVIEHLVDPVAMLRRARALLSPDGLLFITAPHRPKGWGTDASIERWRQWSYNHVPVHLQYFSEASFKRAAETAGLSLVGWYLPGDGEVFEARLRPAREVTMIAMAPVRPAVAANGKAAAGLFGRHLDPHLSDAATQAELREQFESAEPFPWVVIENFLQPDFVQSLIDGFPQKDGAYIEYCRADDGNIGTDYANSNIAAFPPAFQELDRVLRGTELRAFLEAITGINGIVNDPDYFGGGIRESQSNTFLPPHIDFNHHPRTLLHRRLNLLLYLNRDWEEDWGGAIQVHRDPRVFRDDSLVASAPPVLNRVFLFETSERSWHGFNRLQPPPGRSRRAFTIYYYTADRPDAAEVKLHNTEYVEPPLPARFAPGYALTAEDMGLLTEALVRRDGRIEMLYRIRSEADQKAVHVWKEYEYYLARSQQLEAELAAARQPRPTAPAKRGGKWRRWTGLSSWGANSR